MKNKKYTFDDITIETIIEGSGELLVLLPGGGFDVSYLHKLSQLISVGGFKTMAVNPRGISGSIGNLERLTMHDLANDIALVINEQDSIPVHIVGHAFGNRIARCLASDHPSLVKSVILLAAGGLHPPDSETLVAFSKLINPNVSEDEKIDAYHFSLFSPKTSKDFASIAWKEAEQWPEAAKAQRIANQATQEEEWWEAGKVPMFVIQGLDDRVAPVENGRDLKKNLGDRVHLFEIPEAGHMMVLEKPKAVADSVIGYLKDFKFKQ